MKIILSIKPEFAEKILNGTKLFEFRKTRFSVPQIKTVVIYATKPVGKIVGEFDIDKIHIDTPKKIWEKTHSFAGIKKSFFNEYYRDRNVAVAIGVGEIRRFEIPLELRDIGKNITPPQSFRYLPSEVELQLALLT